MAQILLKVNLDSKNATQGLKQLEASIKNIASGLGDVKVNKDLTAQINALTKAMNAAAKQAESNAKQAKLQAQADATRAKAMMKVSESATKQEIAYKKLTIQAANAAHARNNLEKTENKAAKSTKKATEATAKATQKQRENTEQVKKSTEANDKHSQSILSMAGQFLKWQMAATLVMQPLQKLREMLESIDDTLVKTEDAVIALQRVLPSGSATDSEISGALYDLGIKYGQTFENVSQIATNFARTGMEWQDTLKATEAALLALNVAELDASEASDGLIAIMTQFNIQASDLELTIDKLNKTADKFPVTTEKLLVALQRTGSSAANANLSLDETIGLITALSKATGRSGQNLGTAVNSLIQYSSKDSALNIFASLSKETEKIVDSYKKGGATILDVWTEVSKVIKNANAEQQGILKGLAETEDVQNLSQELQDELGDIFETTQDVYGTANTFRKNYFIALLDNIDTVIDAQNVAANALGYSQKENAQAMETYTRKVTALKTEWEKLANDEQGVLWFKKGLVDVGSTILDVIDKLGGLKTVFVNLVVVTLAWVAIFKGKAIFNLIIGGFTSLISIIPNAITAWRAFAANIVSANTAMQASLPVIGLLVTALTLLGGALLSSGEAAKTLEDRIQELNEIQTNIDDLNSKLKENNELIKKANEIGGNDSYILRLKNENEELERQLKTQKALQAEKNKELAAEAYEELTKTDTIKDPYGNIRSQSTILSRIRGNLDAVSRTGDTSYLKNITSDIENVSKYQVLLDKTIPTHKVLYDSISALLDEYVAYFEIQGEAAKETAGTADQIQKVKSGLEDCKDQYEDIIAKAKEYKDELKEGDKLLDKQNAVLKAQQEYEEAIAKAREKYAEEVEKARRELMLAALDDFTSNLEREQNLEDKLRKIEEKRLELNEAIAKAKRNYLKDQLEKYMDGLKEEQALEEKMLAIEEARRKTEEARKKIEEARKKLNDASSQRTVRQYNNNTHTWEWVANQKDVDSAQQELADTQKALLDAENDLSDKQEALNDYLKNEAISEISEYLAAGNYDTNDIQKILNKWLSKGSGGELRTWGREITDIVNDSIVNNKYDDAEVQSQVEGVENAVNDLEDYLRSEAIKEIKTLLNDGNFSMSDIQSILDKWGAKTESGNLGVWEKNLVSALGAAASQSVSVDFDSSGIQSALEKLQSAQSSLSDYFQEKLLDEYIAMFEGGNVSNAKVKALLSKYRDLGVSEDVLSRLASMIQSSTGIDIFSKYMPNFATQATKDKWQADLYDYQRSHPGVLTAPGKANAPLYDNGGILQGMGVKATNRDEAVINPALTSRLMSPVFNRKFYNFSEGLSNLADYVDRMPDGNAVVYRNSSSTVDDHRSYSVNGVPISSDVAEKNTLADIFRMAAFKKN
ncbi:MAG: phage tail tape measure protein [Clostridiales bacterium]|nr:phage tail tape measure protein [Clostridiales bacterium]